jgi:hypothetical protein
MPLRYLLDEHMRGHRLWKAIVQHNRLGIDVLDFLRVGDPIDLALRSPDDVILQWAEREQRILVSLDKRSLPLHLAQHLQAGFHSPGIFVIRRGSTLMQVIDFLVLALSSNPLSWRARIEHIP